MDEIHRILSTSYDNLPDGTSRTVFADTLKQLEDAITKADSRLRALVVRSERVEQARALSRSQVDLWSQWATKALTDNHDHLAMQALLKTHRYHRIAVVLDDRAWSLNRTNRELRKQLVVLHDKLREVRSAVANQRR